MSTSGPSLTSGQLDLQGSPQLTDDTLGNELDDQDRRLPPSKSPSDLFSDVYRGIRKAIPTREDSLRFARAPSRLAFKAFATSPVVPEANSAPLLSRPVPPQHVRNLSLQNSLEKPLPAPPPPSLSPTSPVTPESSSNQIRDNLPAIVDGDIADEANMDSRTNTMDSNASVPLNQMYNGGIDMSSSQSSIASSSRTNGGDGQKDNLTPRSNGPLSAGPSPPAATTNRTPGLGAAVGTPATSGSSAHLSGLMCNVHRTTGQEPHPLVGATTTILGDKLYVFGGRILSRSRPAPLTSDLYELDLIRRHWTKLETTGDVPPPRYFHSMCALGDTKMVCYGGMSPTTTQPTSASPDQQPEVTVMSDIYIYDAPTKKWTYVPSQDAPQGRYAHCACILPSSATFSSHKAPLSALQHNPSSGNPNEGRIGISIDGAGGAEMVVVGGQDGANHYIEQISVFNLRSLKWTSTQPLGKSCGAYRSVVAPLPPSVTAKIGKPNTNSSRQEGAISQEAKEPGSSMLIYSNYNFLDVKLELQIRTPDGSLAEKPMSGTYSPPGLRFPNGGIIDTYFVVSGTYLTSSKQEYALWALDLRNLTWVRIDTGGSVFSQGSWNRGVLWNRRNIFVILGNRKRSLVDDYNHRRINFSNVCMVELEAFGFYDNPRKTSPLSGFVSASSPFTAPGLLIAKKAGWTGGGRSHTRVAEELGEKALALRELADMDILCFHGERIPINSRIVARRWGPYFVQLLREGAATQDGSDSATLRTGISGQAGARMSTSTITPFSRNPNDSSLSMATTLTNNPSSTGSLKPPSTTGTSMSGSNGSADFGSINSAPTPLSLPPGSRPRCLYLPHTCPTVQALLHFLYTSALPPPSSPLCTPQILCSLLQIARPYKIDGLLEAVVERLHARLDSRNAAAVFNATAMAAGGGRGIDGSMNPNFYTGGESSSIVGGSVSPFYDRSMSVSQSSAEEVAGTLEGLRINTSVSGTRPEPEELSATTSVSGSEWSSELGDSERGAVREVWSGELSSVIGLQKRGLRGLMEGRRMRATVDRERDGGRTERLGSRVGLGIAGS
ncbi:kelch domain-containing protein [Hypomontagnella submonticulosa]|nr:kelch domain-containing protein [Hypomontagnella submonticulosa]